MRGSFLWLLNSPAVFWASWGRLGSLKSEKMQTVLCENHFFDSRLFGFLELHLALLGSSRPLPGQFWGPDGIQNRTKSDPKMAPKMSPKMDPILGSSWTNFGGHFGVILALSGAATGQDTIKSRNPKWPQILRSLCLFCNPTYP